MDVASETSSRKGGLLFDPKAAMGHLCANDEKLERLIEAAGPFTLRIDKSRNVFIALAEAIVYQQLSGKAAATIFSRLQALFPNSASGFSPADILQASDGYLRSAGLSRPKILALRDLAQKTSEDRLPAFDLIRRMDNEAVIERLTQVRGIGRWTAEMFLIFRLGRPDVMPLGDLGIQKGFAVAFNKRNLPTSSEILKRSKRWQPYRTMASWYLWRAAEMGRK